MERHEIPIYCWVCGRLLTKMVLILDGSVILSDSGVIIRVSNGDIKIGNETKCNRCKQINSHVVMV